MTDILQEASELINGQRAADYGDVTENFQRIASLWTDYLGEKDWQFTPHDVAMMMILVKMSRLATGGYHRDSLVDIAGYAALDEKLWVAIAAREAEVEAGYKLLAQDEDFWGGIDASIVEAQEKRERDRTQKPPRVWDSLSDVPIAVDVRDKGGAVWHFCEPSDPEYAKFIDKAEWLWHGDGRSINHNELNHPPFTEILDNEPEGSK